jgi:hypothetical protein
MPANTMAQQMSADVPRARVAMMLIIPTLALAHPFREVSFTSSEDLEQRHCHPFLNGS